LRDRGEVPVVFAAEGRAFEAGDVDAVLMESGRAGFDDEDASLFQLLAQARCESVACGAAADDDLQESAD
jgi:hypothetical protein